MSDEQSMNGGGRLSVVVPVRNEADNIIPLIEEIDAALLGKIDLEIIYVDDGSTDATAQKLAAAKSTRPHLKVVRHRDSCGQSTAVRSGVLAASGEWIATLDGDGQNDPADIPRLLEVVSGPQAESDVQLVGGNRRGRRQDSWIKRVSSVIANGVRSRLLRDSTPDTGCGLKLVRRDVFLDLPYFDHMHRFLPALVQRRGGRVVSVPVNHRHRTRGQSNYGTIDRLLVGIVDLFGVMWLIRRSRRPVVSVE
jgi:dolichol-phosphate mannosyltransferase